MTDIFKFWEAVEPKDRIHPADRRVLERVKHEFDLECLPACFNGPLRTAKVVLLLLSPTLYPHSRAEAETQEGQEAYMRRRAGHEPLPMEGPSFKWLKERTECFGCRDQLWPHLAVLNIGAYRSKKYRHKSLLAALPSCRVSIGWAQDVLFPQAEAGERVVVCLRSASFWGLEEGKKYGRSLFAPHVNRKAHMKLGPMREQIIEVVRSEIGRASPV